MDLINTAYNNSAMFPLGFPFNQTWLILVSDSSYNGVLPSRVFLQVKMAVGSPPLGGEYWESVESSFYNQFELLESKNLYFLYF